MKSFGLCLFVFTFIAAVGAQVAFAEQTVGEKVEVKVNNVKREVKKGANKIEEDLCNKKDKDCAAKYVKNRATELKDATVDGVKELKNVVD